MSQQSRTVLLVLAVALGLLLAAAGGALAGGMAGYLIATGERQAQLAPLERRIQLLEREDRGRQAPSQLPDEFPFPRLFLQGEGALVIEVEPGSPAAGAGIRPGTIITEVEGTSVASPHSLPALIHSHDPGDTVKLTVVGPEGEERIEVTLGETQDSDGNVVSWLGVRFRPVSTHGLSRIHGWHPTDLPPASVF